MTVTSDLRRRLRAQSARAPLFIGGFDAGNSTALYATSAGVLQIPSYVGTGDRELLLSTRAGAGERPVLKAGEYVVEYGGATYYVGDLALAQSPDATTQRGDANRYHSGHSLRLLMALAAAAHPGVDSVRLRLVTGLPINLFQDRPDLRRQIRAALEGTHYYTFHDANGTRMMCLEVEAVGIVMEGVAAAMAFGTPGKPQVVIDIGGATFDVAYINAAGEVVAARTGSMENNGSERIGELLSQWFRQKHGRALTAAEISTALTNYLRSEDTTIYERGERIIETGDVLRAIGQVAAAGDSFLSQKLGPNPGSDAACALVIGGAARYMMPELHTEERVYDLPERANVKAYQRFAERAEEKQAWPAREPR